MAVKQGMQVEVSPVRLTPEESRDLIRFAVAAKPITGSYRSNGLEDMGILRRVEIPEAKTTAADIAACWSKARKALQAKDSETLHQAMHDLEALSTDRHRERNTVLFELTDFGKQLARGVRVQLNPKR